MTTKYIIARYNESIGWLHPILSDCIIFNKGKKLGVPNEHLIHNVGRESETYLRFIIENYDDLPDCCVFSQAKIKDHMDTYFFRRKPHLYLKQLSIEALGNVPQSSDWGYHIRGENVKTHISWGINPKIGDQGGRGDPKKKENHLIFKEWFKKNIRDDLPKDNMYHYPFALFAVSKEQIHKHPKEYYENLIKEVNWDINPIEGHYFERSWYYIFN